MEETDRKHGDDKNVHLNPVPPDTSGEGLPYAPENFPNEGDNWRWRVGKRVNVGGYHQDRFVYPPQRFLHLLKEIPTRGGGGFASKLSVKRFVESAFPGADIDAFFESFTWKIRYKGSLDDKSSSVLPAQNPEKTTTDSICCKAQNRWCGSSSLTKTLVLPPMPCDICCSEVGFCRECCCILCCKMVDNSFQGYSYVKCEAVVGDDYTCCHVAHLDCAVRAYMAGTVGGSIGLDAEYYCRRCDAKTELVSHVARLLETCKSSSISSYDQLERVLNVGACVLHGSQKTSAKSLLAQIHQILTKLKHGVPLEEIWNRDNDSSGWDRNDDHHYYSLEQQQQTRGRGSGDECHRSIQYLNLDKDVDKSLEALRKAQESEYKAAEERFHGQREYLHKLYQQLEYESCQLRKQRLSIKGADLMRVVSDRKDQIEREFNKLREMKQVAALGFARASKHILRNHFGMEQPQEEAAAAAQ